MSDDLHLQDEEGVIASGQQRDGEQIGGIEDARLDISQGRLTAIDIWVPEGQVAGCQLSCGEGMQGVVLAVEIPSAEGGPVGRIGGDLHPEKEEGQGQKEEDNKSFRDRIVYSTCK